MSRNQSGGKKFMMGAFFGTLVGGFTALLLAPKSGERMRKDISRKCRKACDKAADYAEHAKDFALDAKKSVKGLMKRK